MDIKEKLKLSLLSGGGKECIVIGDEAYSYDDVLAKINAMDTILSEYSVIGFESRKDIFSYVCILYCVLNDKTFVPVSLAQPMERVIYILNTSKAEALISDGDLVGYDGRVISRSLLYSTESLTDGKSLAISGKNRNDIAYILYTSGSTGLPKGVKVGRESLNLFIENIRKDIKVYPDDRVSQFYELIFDVSIQDIFLALLSNATLVVCENKDRLFTYRFIQEKRISVWSSVPSAVSTFIDRIYRSSLKLPALRISIFAGEALSPELVRKWASICESSEIFNLYGPTETTIGICWTKLSDQEIINGDIPIGLPAPGHTFYLKEDEGGQTKSGKFGELVIEGKQVAFGYISSDSGGFYYNGKSRGYSTGDIVEIREGKMYYLGRRDSQVKLRGYRIELNDVEENLRIKSGYSELYAIVMHEGGVELLVIVSESSEVINRLKRTQGVLPEYMKPDRYVAVENIPRTLSGKTDRNKLIGIVNEIWNGDLNDYGKERARG